MDAIKRMLQDEVMIPLKKINFYGGQFSKLYKMALTLRKEGEQESKVLKADHIKIYKLAARASYMIEQLLKRPDATNPGNSIYTATLSDQQKKCSQLENGALHYIANNYNMKDIASRPEASGLPSALSATVKLKPGSVKYTPKDQQESLSRSSTDYIPPPKFESSTPLMKKATSVSSKSHTHSHAQESKGGDRELRSKVIDITKSQAIGLKKVYIPSTLIQQFVDQVAHNTKRGIETCGMLCGKDQKGLGYIITSVIIPKQEGECDFCQMTDEVGLLEEMERQKVINLGWIHTHPQFQIFLSSVDLHMQAAFQQTLREAIAIVYSPISQSGSKATALRVKDEYLAGVLKCSGQGFHRHGHSQYQQCGHIELLDPMESPPFKLIDLRK